MTTMPLKRMMVDAVVGGWDSVLDKLATTELEPVW